MLRLRRQPLITVCSVGDILMLSQTAWKIGRAFSKGKKGAPSEFGEVEREANGLSEALKLVAATLHTDGSLLAQADDETRSAVNTILESAGRTLEDLESFVERYHVIKKDKTSAGGFAVERNWSEVVLANYKTFKWTTEGGNINDLRNMLQMHATSINLIMQALQSKSLSRLEKTVVPMAENILDIHQTVHGELGSKIDDLHRIIMAFANSTPSLQARDRTIESTNLLRNGSVSTVSTPESANGTATRSLEPPPNPRTSSIIPIRQETRREAAQSEHFGNSPVPARRADSEDSAYFSMGLLAFERERDGHQLDWGFVGASDADQASPGMDRLQSRHTSANESSSRVSELARRESSTLPGLLAAIDDSVAENGGYFTGSSFGQQPTPVSKATSLQSESRQSVLPPPAIPHDDGDGGNSPATPSTIFGRPRRQKTDSPMGKEPARPSTAGSVLRSKRERAASGGSPRLEAPQFEKSLFRNAAILCDVRARTVELAVVNPNEPDPRFNTEMKEICTECRVCVIRKRENREHGGTKVATSIWSLSHDGETRLQQKLSDFNETIPFGSFFDPNKVSLSPSDPGTEITLRLHTDKWGEPVVEEQKTNWVNYILASEADATTFQSAVFGRTLIGSYNTTKSTVIHEGLKGAFAFEEQFANIEMLRLWEEDGTSTPGAMGGVMALMHVSSNFGEGWARWWINSSRQQVRVKEDGFKWAKVKGIDITVVRPGTRTSVADNIRSPAPADEGLQRVKTLEARYAAGGKRTLLKKVTGIRVEFKIPEDRDRFIKQCKAVQNNMVMLPDL